MKVVQEAFLNTPEESLGKDDLAEEAQLNTTAETVKREADGIGTSKSIIIKT